MNDERDLITGQYNINHLYSKLHPQLIASSPALTIGYSYKYKQRFPLGEPSLLENPSYVYFYLSNLSIVGNHEQEKVIATSDVYSHAYAMHILKNRFPLGEPIIATRARESFNYALTILKSRFELGEAIIATDPYYAYNYAIHVLNDRFELGELTIQRNPEFCTKYIEFLQTKYSIDKQNKASSVLENIITSDRLL